jgi:HAE1 family hydrophobic/amphiphilic exporter-1
VGLFRYVIEHYNGTLLLVGLAVILGLAGLTQLPVSFYPDFTVPAAIILTAYPGAGPEEVESEVSKPLEQAVSTISEVDLIESVSQEGFSRVIVSFSFGADVEAKKRQVQERIDLARGLLPREASTPILTTINQLLPPPVQLAVTSETRSLGELTLLAREKIAPSLSRLPGVATAQVAGGSELAVMVEADPLRLRESRISLGQLAAALGAGNADFPLGEVKGRRQSYTLRLKGRYQSLEEVEKQPVQVLEGRTVRVKDLARVDLKEKNRESLARINGRESVGLLVRKPSGGNSVKLADQVNAWLKRSRQELPGDVKVTVVKDESVVIRRSIAEVAVSGLLGGLLASLIIYLFLGRLANTLVIVLSIPATLASTFAAMRLFGLSLNTVSIGGLSLSVGLIVDSAVVVMENAYRRLKEINKGQNRLETVAQAAAEVGLAISASTLTTVVVFLPLAFTAGFAKVLLGELALTVVFALIISIIMAGLLVPVLCFFLIDIRSGPARLNSWFLALMDWLGRVYLKALSWSLGHRLAVMLGFVVLLILGLGMSRLVDTGLLASADQGEFQITIGFPAGTSLEYTAAKSDEIEKKLLATPGVGRVFSIVGQDPFFGSSQPNLATLNVFSDGRAPTESLMEKARLYLKNLPGAQTVVKVIDATSGVRKDDIDVNVFGPDLDTLRALGDRLAAELRSRPENTDLKSNLSDVLPSYIFVPDRQRLAAVGLEVRTLSQAIRSGKTGGEASKYRLGDSELGMELSISGSEQFGIRETENMPIGTPRAGILPLKALGSFVEGKSPPQIIRLNQTRTVNVTGSFIPGIKSQQGRTRLAEYLKSFKLPPGYRAELRGANRAIAESFKTLGLALLAALILVYIVMGVQFNSLSLPLVIMLSVPFSLPGFFGALLATGDQLNLSSFLAAIIISGIVVNNAILLLDFAIAFRKNGGQRNQALLEAGRIRFRPVMMTSLTTIFGALFLALDIGGGGQALKSLARAYMGGLSFGLLVSLLLVPVAYTLMDDFLCRFQRSCMPGEIQKLDSDD